MISQLIPNHHLSSLDSYPNAYFRWRPARGNAPSQGPNRQSNQQQRRNQSREAGQGQSIADSADVEARKISFWLLGNAWQNNERGNKDGPPQGLPQENHVPVRGFNALEVRDALKHGLSLYPRYF